MKAHTCPALLLRRVPFNLRPRAALLLALAPVLGTPPAACAADLLDQPLEALMDVKLTTLGRRVQPEQDMAIATSVFSGDDLHRGGARTVLDVLAWLPGISVERFTARDPTVSCRGDGSSLVARNTLVMRDGREQQTIAGGSPWGFLNLPIERVQRIEVQRGAGNALWGANAANCVINIVTRPGDDGSTGAVDADSAGRLGVAAQWGTRTGSGWSTSFWANGQHMPGSDTFAGRRDWDNLDDRAAGATARLAVEGGTEVVFDVNAYNGINGSSAQSGRATVRREQRSTQREASARLTVPQPQDGRLELTGYLQRTSLITIGGSENSQQVGDLSGQRFWRLGSNDVIAGAGLHSVSAYRAGTGPGGSNAASSTEEQRVQVFAQDEWHFADNRGALIAGAQAQRYFRGASADSLYAGTLRLRWSVSPDLSLWGSLSRSGTTTSSGQDIDIPSFETGLRWRASRDLQLNAGVFEQRFGGLQVSSPAPGGQVAATLDTQLRVHGYETDVRWQASERWSLDGSLTVLRAHFDIDGPGSSPLATEEGYLGASPHKAFKARALYQLDDRRSVELALQARSALAVGSSPGRGVLDLTYRQRVSPRVEFGSALRQLNHDSLPNFKPPNTPFPYREVRTLAMWVAWGV